MLGAGTKRRLNRYDGHKAGARLEGTREMRKFALAAALAAAGMTVAGCATDPYGYGNPYGYNNGYYQGGYYNNGYYGQQPYYGGNSQAGNVVGGAAIGAATGAIAGAVLPGIRPGTGAVAGAILGGVLGATVNGHQYYRDTRGYCYYVDRYGQPHYSYDVRC
jgi:hypothetical protein